MEKNTQWLVVTFTILALIAGFSLGGLLIENEKVVEKTITEEVPVNVTKEVPVEVEVEKDFDSYRNELIDMCMDEFIDSLDLDKYQSVILYDSSDDWNYTAVFDGENKTVTQSISELKFKKFDTLTDERFIYSKSCTVVTENDEEPEIVLA